MKRLSTEFLSILLVCILVMPLHLFGLYNDDREGGGDEGSAGGSDCTIDEAAAGASTRGRADAADRELEELLRETGEQGFGRPRLTIDRNTLFALNIHSFVEQIHANRVIWDLIRNRAGTNAGVPQELVESLLRAYHARYGREEGYVLLPAQDGSPYLFTWTINDMIDNGNIPQIVDGNLNLELTYLTDLAGIERIAGWQDITMLVLAGAHITRLPDLNQFRQSEHVVIVNAARTGIVDLPAWTEESTRIMIILSPRR